MKKLLVIVLCAVMVMSLLVACDAKTDADADAGQDATDAGQDTADTSSDEGDAPDSEDTATDEPLGLTEEEVTLQWVGAGWLANDLAAGIIAEWEELHPNIHIEYVELSSRVDADYLKNLDIMIAGDEQVDITYLGVDDMFNRVMNGGALPIGDYVEAMGHDFEADFGSLATTTLSYDGEVYGIPFANNTFKVFYNKTMLDEKGIEIPETWSIEIFTEIANQLNDPENGVYGCVFPSNWQDLCYAPAEISGWQSVVKDADGNPVPNFDNETFKKCMQWVYNLAETDKVSPSYATIKAESLNRRIALAEKQAAMIVDGPYTLVWLNRYMWDDPGAGALDFELGVADIPYVTEDGSDVSFNTLVGTFYVPKSSAYPLEAYAFMHFLCTKKAQEITYMPTYLGADQDVATETFLTYTDVNGEVHENIYETEVAKAAVATPNESHVSRYSKDPAFAKYYNIMYTLFGEQYTLFLAGEVTIDEFVETMQTLGAAEIANAG